MENKVSWAVTRRHRDFVGIVRRELAFVYVEIPDQDSVHAKVGRNNALASGVGINHVRMGSIVAADGEAARRRACGMLRTDGSGVLVHVRGRTEFSIGFDGQNSSA